MAGEFDLRPYETLAIDLKDPAIKSTYRNVLNMMLTGNKSQADSILYCFERTHGEGLAKDVAVSVMTDVYDLQTIPLATDGGA